MATSFKPNRVLFGDRPPEDETDQDGMDNGEGLPSPIRRRQHLRRVAGIKEARGILEHLPGPGESLHAIFTSRLDLSDVLNAMLDKVGQCSQMHIATLGLNERNLVGMLNWLDSGKCRSLTLLASIFFRSHKGKLWEQIQQEFRTRGQQTACCHSHAKVCVLRFENGTTFSVEGSSNLCSSGSGREQIAVFHDDALADWHAGWITDLVRKYEGHERPGPREN